MSVEEGTAEHHLSSVRSGMEMSATNTVVATR